MATRRRQRSGTESQEIRAGSMEVECGVRVERVFRRVCASCSKAREDIWERVGRRGMVAWWRVKVRGDMAEGLWEVMRNWWVRKRKWRRMSQLSWEIVNCKKNKAVLLEN
jgi:hypothetical protein